MFGSYEYISYVSVLSSNFPSDASAENFNRELEKKRNNDEYT